MNETERDEAEPVVVRPAPPEASRLSPKAVWVVIGVITFVFAAMGYGLIRSSNRRVIQSKKDKTAAVQGTSRNEADRVVEEIPPGLLVTGTAAKIAPHPLDVQGKTASEVGGKALADAMHENIVKPLQNPGSVPAQGNTPGYYPAPAIQVQPAPLTPEQARRRVLADLDARAATAPLGMIARAAGPANGAPQAPGLLNSGSADHGPAVTDAMAQVADIERQLLAATKGGGGAAGIPSQEQIDQLAATLGYSKTAASAATQNGGATRKVDLSQSAPPPGDYIAALRQPPVSPYEIMSGWDIPAMVDQSTNSDLPGDVRALVTANVYDTVTGAYLLIPQGSRLLGKYDNHLSYGQTALQFIWYRVIFPDGTSVDLGPMEALSASGDAGLRGKVDHHFAKLVETAALTTLLATGFAITQSRGGSVLTQPSLTASASQGAGTGLQQVGNRLIDRQISTQPTIKIFPGTPFDIRVNRDLVFNGPYIERKAPDAQNPAPAAIPGQQPFATTRVAAKK